MLLLLSVVKYRSVDKIYIKRRLFYTKKDEWMSGWKKKKQNLFRFVFKRKVIISMKFDFNLYH